MKYKHLIVFVISVALFLGMSFSMTAQDEQAQDQGAEKSHKALKKLPKKALEILNLTEAEAAKTARGEKLKVYMLGLNKLKAFEAGDNTKKVMIDTQEIVYPIYVGSVLKTALSIRKRQGGWKDASMGSAEIHFLEPVRKAHAKANGINVKSYYIVRVPGLYLSFLGYDLKGKMYLIPTHTSPDVKLNVGKSVSAEEIYLDIQPLVAKYEKILTRPKK